jgi:hypothetical protein
MSSVIVSLRDEAASGCKLEKESMAIPAIAAQAGLAAGEEVDTRLVWHDKIAHACHRVISIYLDPEVVAHLLNACIL